MKGVRYPNTERKRYVTGKVYGREWVREHLFHWETVYLSTPSSVVSVTCISQGPENDPLPNVPSEGQ